MFAASSKQWSLDGRIYHSNDKFVIVFIVIVIVIVVIESVCSEQQAVVA